MNARPRSITIIGWIFVAYGCIALVGSVLPLIGVAGSLTTAEIEARPVEYGLISALRVAAGVGGAFMLRGSNWARWLIVAWMAYHVVISIERSPVQVAVHAVFLVLLLYFLLHPKASAYFRGANAEAP